jgi:hypothetical protein
MVGDVAIDFIVVNANIGKNLDNVVSYSA